MLRKELPSRGWGKDLRTASGENAGAGDGHAGSSPAESGLRTVWVGEAGVVSLAPEGTSGRRGAAVDGEAG